MFTKSFRRPPAVFIFLPREKASDDNNKKKHQKAHHVNMKWYTD